MTESAPSSPSSSKPHWIPILLVTIALFAFTALVLVQAFRNDLNMQEETLTAGSAETLTTLGRNEEAIEVYTRLLTLSRGEGNFSAYHLNRGDLYFAEEQYDEALEDYQAAISRDELGLLYQARWNKAQTLSRLGREEEAKAGFEAFIEEYGGELPHIRQRAEVAIALLEK